MSPETLSEKHRAFVPLIAAIERVEGSVGEVPSLILRASTGELHQTLAHGLIPHAIGEGRTVFPVLRRITGTSDASVAMNREHVEIGRLTDELEKLRNELAGAGMPEAQERALHRVLSDLRRVVAQHFDEEEQVCFSILSTELGEDEAREICAAVDRAAAEIREAYE